jgi:penicillin-binding protein 1A
MYLNTVHFGHGTYGVEAATKRFFGKESKELSVDESALLVGLLPSPASYSPVRHPERARKRRNTVLRLMKEQGYITYSEHSQYRAMTLESITDEPIKGLAPYFTEYVRRLLEKEDEVLDINIYRDGLKIYTTLDSRLQVLAEKFVLNAITKSQGKLNNRIMNNQEEFEL